MRLAEHVAHTTDVDGMLDSMTPKQFDEWCAKDAVEPIGTEATRMVLGMIGVSMLASMGCSDAQLSWFLPWVKEKEEKEEVTTWASHIRKQRDPDVNNR